MIGQQFERVAHAQKLLAGAGRILCGDEIERPPAMPPLVAIWW
jgi:hypothetical protein